MKILMFFMDMFRANLLNIVNTEIKEREIDIKLKEIGGVVYTNCFTPAPDTPRSVACLWSGKYPKRNGCDFRIKWPGKYMDTSNENILSLLEQEGYDFNFYINSGSRKLGMLPQGFDEKDIQFGDCELGDYLSKVQCANKSFTFIYTPDFHKALDDYGATKEAVELGYEILCEEIDMIKAFIEKENFDLVILFSDHGFMYREESHNMGGAKLLSANRTQIYMQIKTKQMNGITKDTKLRSIMDIYPTIMNLADIDIKEHQLDGMSLMNEEEHEYLLMEDHKTFNCELGQTIEYWGVRNKKGYAVLDCSGTWEADYAISDKEKEIYQKEIELNMSCYKENRKAYESLRAYISCETKGDKFANGRIRKRVSRRSLAKNFNDKYQLYYSVMDRWMENKQKGVEIQDFFESKNINTIAIYGMAELGCRLYEELKNSKVKVLYGIDRAEESTNELQIKRIYEELPKVDAVVVTALLSYENIKQNLQAKCDYQIINFLSIITNDCN